jgi:tetratricopeptide (TPR) repeat protein
MRLALAALAKLGKWSREIILGIHVTATYNRGMRSFPQIASTAAVLFVTAFDLHTAFAQDPSIDRLLKKLPPPEKLIKVDPAQNDRLVRQVEKAAKAQNFGQALELSRKLAQRYPKSVGAQAFRGMFAFQARRYDESADAFRKVIAIQPNIAFAHFGLGAVEFLRGRFTAATPHFRKSLQLEPKAGINWIFLSACADKLGRKQEALDYAKRATALSPAFPPAWFQLAQVEGSLGHEREAAAALKRARQTAKKFQRPR